MEEVIQRILNAGYASLEEFLEEAYLTWDCGALEDYPAIEELLCEYFAVGGGWC